jgi:hypothetical protein
MTAAATRKEALRQLPSTTHICTTVSTCVVAVDRAQRNRRVRSGGCSLTLVLYAEETDSPIRPTSKRNIISPGNDISEPSEYVLF